MRTGDGSTVAQRASERGATARRASQRGFTYLWLLFVLAAGGAGLAVLGQQVSTAVQREREVELMFRGQQIVQALARFAVATPGPVKTLPATLQELLDDRRTPQPGHHLRSLYTDPFTGRADWVLLLTEGGQIEGVHSRARVTALRSADLPTPPAGRRALVSDRIFRVSLPTAAASAVTPPATRTRRGGPDDNTDLPRTPPSVPLAPSE